MSRNWIVRQGAPSIELDKSSKTVLIFTARRVSIRQDDVLILLNEHYVFTHIATVVEVARVRVPSGDKGITEVTHKGWQALEAPVEFELFTSSLTFVKNQDRPKLHLRPGYRMISDTDRETVEACEPFLARETYVTLLGALPESMKRNYLAEQLLAEGADGLRSFQERVNALLEFIDTRILKLGEMIIKVDETWEDVRQLAEVQPSVEPLFASDDESVAPDSIRSQADQFRAVREFIGTEQSSPTAFDLLRKAIQAQQTSPRIRQLERFFSGVSA